MLGRGIELSRIQLRNFSVPRSSLSQDLFCCRGVNAKHFLNGAYSPFTVQGCLLQKKQHGLGRNFRADGFSLGGRAWRSNPASHLERWSGYIPLLAFEQHACVVLQIF
jgi:hypothetical protein